MNLKLLTISTLSIFLLAGCVSDGDFCAVYSPVPPLRQEVAAQLVSENRASAVSIAANETFYARNCAG